MATWRPFADSWQADFSRHFQPAGRLDGGLHASDLRSPSRGGQDVRARRVYGMSEPGVYTACPSPACLRLGWNRTAVRITGPRANFRLDPPSNIGSQMMLDPLGRRMQMIQRQLGMPPQPGFPESM